MNLKENYGNIRCYISENGMGVEGEERFVNEQGIIEDDYRIEFVQDHLKWVHKRFKKVVMFKDIICGRIWITGLGSMPIKSLWLHRCGFR